MTQDRAITNAESYRLRLAVRKARAIGDYRTAGDGIYQTDADGWRFIIAVQGQEWKGWALHGERGLSVPLPEEFVREWHSQIVSKESS